MWVLFELFDFTHGIPPQVLTDILDVNAYPTIDSLLFRDVWFIKEPGEQPWYIGDIGLVVIEIIDYPGNSAAIGGHYIVILLLDDRMLRLDVWL